jgi:hypothetical protein
MKTMPIEELTFEVFSGLINTSFRVRTTNKTVELRLAEVTRSGGPADSAANESFSLLFHGPGDQLLPQQILTLENAQMGRFDLFIVPVGKTANGFEYQAIFNRLHYAAK